MPRETYLKVYLVLSTLVGVALAIFVIFGLGARKYINTQLPVNFSFTQEANNTPEHSDFKLMLEPRSYRISFVKVRIYFNPDIIQLADETGVFNSPLSLVSITPANEANLSGNIEITLAQAPEAESPDNTFEIASLIFTKKSSDPSEITIVDEDTHVIGRNSEEIPFTSDYASINMASKGI